MSLRREVRGAAEIIVGNLEDNGYLLISDEELATLHPGQGMTPALMGQARRAVQTLDPIGVAACDLRECLLLQLAAAQSEIKLALVRAARMDEKEPSVPPSLHARRVQLQLACRIVEDYLSLLQKRDVRELARLLQFRPIRSMVPSKRFEASIRGPVKRYNQMQTRLIEPDVAFARRGEEWAVVMNEEDLPALRLNAGYRRMLRQKTTDREVKEYVKERYRSAIQLLRNIEQRKNTIVRTCECIVRRQGDFLERGVDALRPMMIKEVGGRDRCASFHREPRGVEQICAHAPGCVRAAFLFYGRRQRS